MKGRRPYRRFRQLNPHAPKHFTEVVKLEELTSPATGSAPSVYNFYVTGDMIQNLRNDLKNVFRQFCVTGVKIMYLPNANNYFASTGGPVWIPRIFFQEDKVTGQAPEASVNLALQADNVKILDASKRFTHYISRPRPWADSMKADNVTDPVFIQPESRAIQWVKIGSREPAVQEETNGLLVPWLNSTAVVQANSTASPLTIGTVYARIYYSCKEQY